MQTLNDTAVFNNFLQLIAQLLIIYCCIFLFRTHARVNTRTRATSNLCEHRGRNDIYASRLKVPLNKSFVRRESANY